MLLDLMSHKIRAIEAVLTRHQLNQLDRCFQKLGLGNSQNWNLTSSELQLIFLDSIFGLLKNKDWINTQVLSLLMIQSLQRDHQVPSIQGSKILKLLSDAFQSLGLVGSRTICIDDREFLNYVYSQVASNNDDYALECQLGLGSALLDKLRDGLKVIDDRKLDEFVPEYDGMMASIVVEYMHHLKTNPIYIDLQRLKYFILQKSGDQSVPWIYEDQLPDLLQTLFFLCSEDESVIAKKLKSEVSLKSSYDFLCNIGLLQNEVALKHQIKFRPTDLAYDLTDEIFRQSVSEGFLTDKKDFLGIPSRWQLSLITHQHRCLTLEKVGLLLQFHLEKFSPEILEELINLYFDRSSSNEVSSAGVDVLQTIESWLSSTDAPWQKAAIIRGVSKVSPSDELADLIADAVSKDQTPSVREAANTLIDSWSKEV